MSKNEIAETAQAGALALNDDMLAMMAGAKKTDDFKSEDILIPYLQIVQSMSPYMKRNDPQYLPDAREGDIIDTLSLKLRDKAAFVPVKYEVRYTEWGPNQGGLVKQWGTDRSGYDAADGDYGTRRTEGGNDIVPSATYYGLLLDETGTSQPVILSLTGTQAKKARRLATLISALEFPGPDGEPFMPPMYSRVYALTAVPESNDKGSWMGWRIEPGALLLTVLGGKGLFLKAQKLREQVDAGAVKANETAAAATESSQRQAASDDDVPF
jgi:hypothetical protein